MSKFILGLLCGIGLTLLTPWAHQNILSEPMKTPETPPPTTTPAPTQENNWRYDKSRGTLNQAPVKSGKN